MSEEDEIERIKRDALNSYGDNREDAIDTLAVYGEDAVSALLEIAEKSVGSDHQKYARKKVREIKQDNSA